MFYACESLKTLDISSFDTRNVRASYKKPMTKYFKNKEI